MSSGNLFPYQPPPPDVVDTSEGNTVRSALTMPSTVTPGRVPNYKDQVSGDEERTTPQQAIDETTSNNDSLPVVRAHDAKIMPTFKQQTDSGIVQELPSDIPNANAIPIFDSSTMRASQVRDDDDDNNARFTMSSSSLLPSSTRCIGILAVVLAVVAAGTIGILCASGRCRSSSASSPESFSTEDIVSLVNANTLWDANIRYPISNNKIGTPEQQALTWIVEDDQQRSNNLQILQRYALATIWFQSTIPWDMEASGNWLDPNIPECQWDRVVCNEGVLTELDLRSVNAHGKIPKDLALLSDMTLFRMDSNALTGTLPSELGLLTKLTALELDQNQFNGSIPTEWANLSWLTVIDLVNAGLSGPVEAVVRGWSRIQVLSLSDNQFTGRLPVLPLPGSFVTFYGYFHNTLLEGPVPFCSNNNPNVFKIEQLVADCNRMDCPCCTACCPVAMNDIPMYDYCVEQSRSEMIVNFINSVTFSAVRLVYPSRETAEEVALSWLIDDDPLQLHQGNFVQLQQRYALATLYFAGTWEDKNRWLSDSNECEWVGIECTNSQSVSEIRLTDGVDIEGTVPADLALLTSLRLLHLFNNGHSGTIPSSLGGLEFLEELEIHVNRLTGSIPTELGKFTSMYSLSVFANFFGSTIPSELGKLSTLIHLALSDNQFTGTIPTEFWQLEDLQHIFIHNNDQLGGSLEFLCQRNLTSVIADCDKVTCPCCNFCCVEGGFNGIPEYGEAEGWCRDDAQ